MGITLFEWMLVAFVYIIGIILYVLATNKNIFKKSIIKGYKRGRVKIFNLEKFVKSHETRIKIFKIAFFISIIFLLISLLSLLFFWNTNDRILFIFTTSLKIAIIILIITAIKFFETMNIVILDFLKNYN